MTTRTRTQRPRRDRGSMLLVSVIAVIVMTGIAMAYFSTSLAQSNKSFQDALVNKATYTAICGVNCAIVDLNEKRTGNLDGNAYYPNTITNRDNSIVLFGNAANPSQAILDVPARATYNLAANKLLAIGARPSGDFTTTATLSGQNYIVVSTGVFDRKVATVEAVLKKNITSDFIYACFAQSSLTFNGGTFCDSYDSAKGLYANQTLINNPPCARGYVSVHGDCGTNGTIGGGSNCDIVGNIGAGVGQPTFTGGNFVYGTRTPETTPRVLTPYVYTPPTTQNDNSKIATIKNNAMTGATTFNQSGVYYLTSLNYAITVTVPGVTIYVDGGIGKKTPTITVNNNASLVMHSDGGIDCSGNSVVNLNGIPGDFIYKTSATSVDLTGKSEFYGAVYAPNADAKVAGNGAVYGAVVANNITFCGGGNSGGFHYDEALGRMDSPNVKYLIDSMRTASVQSY